MIDEYLIRQMQAGDKAAMEKLIRRYYDKIYSYCYMHVGNVETAQDLTQETFCSMIAHIGEYMHYGKIQNYLYIIAGNKCKDYYRKKKPCYMDDIPETVACAKEEETELADRLALRQMVERLPKELQEVIILRFYGDLRYKDIAEVMGVGISLVKYRVKKGLAILKDEMERS